MFGMGLVQICLGLEEWQPPKPLHWSQASNSRNGKVPSNLVLVDRDQVITKHLCNLKTGFRDLRQASHVNGLSHETGYVPVIRVWSPIALIQPIASAIKDALYLCCL